MVERVRAILALLDERSSRERFLVCFTLLAAIFVIWNSLLMSPLKKSRATAGAEISANQNAMNRLETETRTLEAKLKIDPNELNRQTKSSIEQEIWKVDQEIVEQTADLIPPQEMARALRQLLVGKRDLQLVRLESLPPEPLSGHVEASEEEDDTAVYLHTVELELAGSYMSALRYVNEIEALPWNLLWDAMEYEVIEYPKGKVVLRVQSLSTKEGWIGA